MQYVRKRTFKETQRSTTIPLYYGIVPKRAASPELYGAPLGLCVDTWLPAAAAGRTEGQPGRGL